MLKLYYSLNTRLSMIFFKTSMMFALSHITPVALAVDITGEVPVQ